MNKNFFKTILCAATIVAPCFIYAQENVNLLKNSEMKLDGNGKLANWSGSAKITQDAGNKSPNSARVPIEGADTFSYMVQGVNKLKQGKYVLTAYIKLSRKINIVGVRRIINVDGKDFSQQGANLTTSEQPEPETWTKIMAEFDIPAGTDSATIVFDFVDESPGATIWVDSPVLYYKPGSSAL